MEFEQLRSKLEAILNKKVSLQPSDQRVIEDGEAFEAGRYKLVVHGALTRVERDLIALVVKGNGHVPFNRTVENEDERRSLIFSEWILERLEEGETEADIPEMFSMWFALSGQKLPFLLYVEHPERQQQSAYSELIKLLNTFFQGNIVLVPLRNRHWLILADSDLFPDDGEESVEESIGALASGLQVMVSSEWVGECHVAATYPFSPAASLLRTVAALRETIELGRMYRISSYIHLPWELRLETLLDAVPARVKLRFVEGVLNRAEASFDVEMQHTLEAFFSENCNVSDTAKRLYIHRNTLLYRLDKFKQETGMDVREFDHAVLVRLALLLYKVTKRK